ncbi:hypothetical protein DFH29DRAFT_944363 [Suillus ampliporus]|nr:hypothetical protein DFH29DRAFT_944363 [Suillus ampliporus]
MFVRFSTAFCALLGLAALLAVNAGTVPAARDIDKRTNVVGVGNYAEQVARNLDLDKRTNVAGGGSNPEPDPGKPQDNNLEHDPGKPQDNNLEHDPGKPQDSNPEPDPSKP